jgi:hypothetical protein
MCFALRAELGICAAIHTAIHNNVAYDVLPMTCSAIHVVETGSEWEWSGSHPENENVSIELNQTGGDRDLNFRALAPKHENGGLLAAALK